MAVSISKIWPIQSIESDIIVNGNGDLTIGYRIEFPEVYTLPKEGYQRIHEQLIKEFKTLPIGAIIHKQDFFYANYYNAPFDKFDNLNYTQSKNLYFFDTKPILKNHSNLYITLTSDKKKASKNAALTLADYVFNKPLSDIEKNAKKLQTINESIINGLGNIQGIRIQRLNDDQLLSELQKYWNLDYKNLEIQNSRPLEPLEVNDDFIRIGNQYIGIISLIEEADNIYLSTVAKTNPGDRYSTPNDYVANINLETSHTFPISLGLPIDHIVNTVITIVDNDKMVANYKTEVTKLNVLAGIGYEPAKAKLKAINEYIDALTSGGYQATKTAVNIIVHNDQKEKLTKDIALSRSAFQGISEKIWQENLGTYEMFWAHIPGNARFSHRSFTNVLNTAVVYIPKENHYYNDKSGFVYLDRLGNPVLVNVWNSPYLKSNKNEIVIGPSGSGKSYYINGFIDQSFIIGSHVIVMDIGASYKKSCQVNDGLYLDSAIEEAFQFMIFPSEQLEEEEMTAEVEFIFAIIKMIWKESEKLSTEAKTILKKIIDQYIQSYLSKNEKGSVIGFYDYVTEFKNQQMVNEKSVYKEKFIDYDSLLLTLDRFTIGKYKKLLNAEKNIDITADRMIVFELEHISKNPDIFNIVSLVITNLVRKKIEKLPLNVKKTFIIDEALDFLKSDIGEYIGFLYRTFRKKGGKVTIAAQDIQFLNSTSNEVRQSIISNSGVKVLLNHSTNTRAYDDLRKMLSLTENDIKMLDTLKMGDTGREFMIKMDDYARVFIFQVSPYANAVYTTNPDELQEIYTQTELSGGNMHTGILNYLNNKHNEKINNSRIISNQ